MNRAFAIACAEDETTVTTNIFGVVLDELAMEDGFSHLVRSDDIDRCVHGIKRMREVENALASSLANSVKKGSVHN